ncbi:cystatin-like fold lipoprotein [Bacillus licheniformis]|uniref:cystatin-like fold lipoprotein n=1 Tax=Bacillus licheniformis TaxID=1402 RepID=UPI0003189F92|nr:cystatin-like fold lipoprotein [Bacillus licheniformis]
MRHVFIFLSLIMMFALTACGGNKYDEAIDKVISQEKKSLKEMNADNEDFTRDNAVIRVYDGGKYIQFAFYMKNHIRELSTFRYYEKVGDSYQKLDRMPGDGTGDRLGLDRKKPDYEEVKGKETKLEN